MSGVSTKERTNNSDNSDEKPTLTLPGTVEKIVHPADPRDPEKAQIHIDGAEPLYREIRVENTLTDAVGQPVKLKKGSHVDVTIEANAEDTIPANSTTPKAPDK